VHEEVLGREQANGHAAYLAVLGFVLRLRTLLFHTMVHTLCQLILQLLQS
jgi:hypothetical protein